MQPMTPGYGAPPAAPTTSPAGGIVMLVLAFLIGLGTVSRSWIAQSHGDDKFAIGLVGSYMCIDGECKGQIIDDRSDSKDDKEKAIVATGWIGFLGGLVAAGFGVIGGILILTRKNAKMPWIPVYPIYAVLLLVDLSFIGQVLDMYHGEDKPPVGWSAMVTVLALIAGIIVVAAWLHPAARRERRANPMGMGMGMSPYGMQPMPMQPMGMPQPMPMQQPLATPPAVMQAPSACPRCGGALQFVAQYQRSFCPACQQYA